MEDYGSEQKAFNDFFKIGIAVNWNKTGKMNIKLYEQFYSADIIVASPLAVKMLCNHQVNEKAMDLEVIGHVYTLNYKIKQEKIILAGQLE